MTEMVPAELAESITLKANEIIDGLMDPRYMACPFREYRDSTPCGNCETCEFTRTIRNKAMAWTRGYKTHIHAEFEGES